MNKAIAIAAVAGLAGTAAAQTLNITADVTSAVFGDTITWTVSVTGVASGDYVQGYDLNLNASADLGAASTFTNNLSAIAGNTIGVAAGASLLGASGGQSSLIDPGSLTLGDVVLGSFTVVAGAEGVLSYSVTDGGQIATNIIRGRSGSDFGPISFDGPAAVNSSEVTITPTPASAALLGLGGLVAARRRR